MASRRELVEAEDARWAQLCSTLRRLPREELERPGYAREWSVKDLLAHLGAWQAETVQVLEQIRNETYVPFPYDVDDWNERFYEANRDLPLRVVRAELAAARTRMLQEWSLLPEVTPLAEHWFRESGPAHYEEHLPRLREWIEELRAGRGDERR